MQKEYYDVAFFPDTLKRGGAERVTIRLSEYMQNKGMKVAIITTNNPCDGEYKVPYGVSRICVGIKEKNLLKLVVGYIKLLKKIHISMGIIMGLPQGCYIIPACLRTKTKCIISERNSPENFDGKQITKWIMTFMMKFADGYIFQTKEAKNYYKIKKPYRIISNPVDSAHIPKKKTETIISNIISVGRYAPQKNQRLLIEAIQDVRKKYPNVHLDIYGEGQLFKKLKNLIVDMNLQENVCLKGTSNNILEIEATYGMFVLSSDFEGIPNALLEAMAIGLPCISTDCPCGGPASVINNKENGLLVPVGNKKSMASAIIWMIEHPYDACKMGKCAEKVRDVFSIQCIGDSWIEFIRTLRKEEERKCK